MAAYYNEHDPFAAAWLRELIRDGLIAPGEVDDRSIEDVTPDELRPFRQCHFFAGIGVWSLAARLAGIDDDAPLWSGSCPCQPFSAAGKGGGFDDERHLWPAFHYLIEQCRPSLVVGEQVAGSDGDAWLDLVSADLDATGYAFGAVETVAAGFGAPHKRSRNYWLAHAVSRNTKFRERGRSGPGKEKGRRTLRGTERRGDVGGLADSDSDGRRAEGGPRRNEPEHHAQFGGPICDLADAIDNGQRQHRDRLGGASAESKSEFEQRERVRSYIANGCSIDSGRPGPVNGWWRDADWLQCRDEKWRAVEPDTFPLADAGAFRNRVGLLRGAGNAITIGQAEGFLRAVIASIR